MSVDDLDLRTVSGPQCIRQTQESVGGGVFEIVDYVGAGFRRRPWWAFWRKKEQEWRQVGPARQEVRLEDAAEAWILAAWNRDFGEEGNR